MDQDNFSGPMRSKKHHYVPQCLLRQFSINGERKQIHVFDKRSGGTYPSAVRNAACENDFNVVRIGRGKGSFEDRFQRCDEALGSVLATLNETPHLKALTPSQLGVIPYIVATQLTRTKLARSSMRTLSGQLKDILSEAGVPPEEVAAIPLPTEEEIKSAMVRALGDLDALVNGLASKNGLLIQAPKEDLFLSDNPVVLSNSFPYGNLGVDSPGVEVYLPLSPGLAIAMYCPTILRKIPAFLRSAAPDADKQKYYELAQALIEGHPTSLGSGMATYLNELQVVSSSRFLFSAKKEFELAVRILAVRPDLGRVESLMTMGKMGQAFPRKPRMPLGTWAVFEGSLNHEMIPIVEWVKGSEPLQMTTRMMNVRHALEACGELVQCQLFQDGNPGRGMRDVKVDFVPSATDVTLFVSHRDESLNELMKKLRSRRSDGMEAGE